MDDLIKRALLGDRAAQQQLTNRGELLPCPKCNKSPCAHEDLLPVDRESGKVKIFYKIYCPDLHACVVRESSYFLSLCAMPEPECGYNAWKAAVEEWNTRPKLVTFCKNCKHYCKGKCMAYDEFVGVEPNDFCGRGEEADNKKEIDK